MPDSNEPIIGPYEPRPAECREYDPRAAVVARQIADLITSQLPQVQVEHMGSTAVPGCAGKGIVDLMILCLDGEQLVTVRECLDKLGFQRQEGRDPFPEDRPMRVGAWDYDGETFMLHIHVIPANSPELEEMRFFRACLRGDPVLLKLYVARKQEIIASGMTDSLDYCYAKGEFIKEVLG